MLKRWKLTVRSNTGTYTSYYFCFRYKAAQKKLNFDQLGFKTSISRGK